MFATCCCKSHRERGAVEVLEPENCSPKGASEVEGFLAAPVAENDGIQQISAPNYTNVPNMFQVSIAKLPEDPVGLDLDLLDETGIMVNAVLSGAVNSWNMVAAPDLQVRHGDRIVEVNGARGDSRELLRLLRDEENVQMWVKRPVVVRISGDNSIHPIGLVITYAPDGTTLLIQQVKAGIVADWNEIHKEVTVGRYDRIIEVNGSRGYATDLMALLQKQKLELVIFCYNE